MKTNLLLILTMLLLFTLAIHTFAWVEHLFSPHDSHCSCFRFQYDLSLISVSTVLSILLFSLSFLAYRRTGMLSLLLISGAYATLILYSILWLVGNAFSKSSIWHTVLHDFGGLFFFPALILTLLAVNKRNK